MFFKGKETFVDLWRLYDFMRPILKHGANDSDACASLRVIEILRYNESEQVRPPRRRVIDGLKVFLSSIVGIYLFIYFLSLPRSDHQEDEDGQEEEIRSTYRQTFREHQRENQTARNQT